MCSDAEVADLIGQALLGMRRLRKNWVLQRRLWRRLGPAPSHHPSGVSMKSPPSLLDALADQSLFADLSQGPSWTAWKPVVKSCCLVPIARTTSAASAARFAAAVPATPMRRGSARDFAAGCLSRPAFPSPECRTPWQTWPGRQRRVSSPRHHPLRSMGHGLRAVWRLLPPVHARRGVDGAGATDVRRRNGLASPLLPLGYPGRAPR
jgi:hypothetical protein